MPPPAADASRPTASPTERPPGAAGPPPATDAADPSPATDAADPPPATDAALDVPPALAAVRGRGPVGPVWKRRATIVLFLLPALTLYVLLALVPIVQGVFYSGFDWNGLEPLTEFVGLQNYREALSDPVFLAAIRHVFIILALSLFLQLPFALGLAVLLNQRMRGRAVFRLLFFLPFVLSDVITAIVWRLLLQPSGLVDTSLEAAGLGGWVRQWLADPDVVLFTLFVVISWKYFGFHMILYLAGLQQIPSELEEAAALDGAAWGQRFRYVTLPLLGPTIRISVFLSIIGSLQLFDLVWVMTGGGPVGASHTTVTYMLDRGFERSRFGYGSAVSFIAFVISFVIALGYQRFVLRRDVAGALTTMGA
jgi:raffinose/stachyose/melibiose transport system permease protein